MLDKGKQVILASDEDKTFHGIGQTCHLFSMHILVILNTAEAHIKLLMELADTKNELRFLDSFIKHKNTGHSVSSI